MNFFLLRRITLACYLPIRMSIDDDENEESVRGTSTSSVCRDLIALELDDTGFGQQHRLRVRVQNHCNEI